MHKTHGICHRIRLGLLISAFICTAAFADDYTPVNTLLRDGKLVEAMAKADEFLAKNAFTEKQIGQATGMFMKAHGAQVDPGAANALIKAKLAGK